MGLECKKAIFNTEVSFLYTIGCMTFIKDGVYLKYFLKTLFIAHIGIVHSYVTVGCKYICAHFCSTLLTSWPLLPTWELFCPKICITFL